MEVEQGGMVGPFITVVSVDGGTESGNKLTVITPTEINNDSPRLSVVHEEDVEEEEEYEEEDDTEKMQELKKEDDDELEPSSSSCLAASPSSINNHNNNSNSQSKNRGAYVTVLSLGKNDECNNNGKNEKKKSVVNICAGPPESTPHVVAILSKTDSGKERSKTRLSSVVDIMSNENKNFTSSQPQLQEQRQESDEWVTEVVTVYKLPGERLGFGLRFDGGVSNPLEKVKGLFIQSCAEDSPAARTKASWGNLVEGDEILEIERSPVVGMTRMDCIQSLKDASVVLHLLIRHFYSSSEKALRRKKSADDSKIQRTGQHQQHNQQQNLCQDQLLMKRNNNLNNHHHHNNNGIHAHDPDDAAADPLLHVTKTHIHAQAEDATIVLAQQPAEPVHPQPQPRLRHVILPTAVVPPPHNHSQDILLPSSSSSSSSSPPANNDNPAQALMAPKIYHQTESLIINNENFTIPIAPPRKIRSEFTTTTEEESPPSPLSLKIKPPTGFADDDNSNNNNKTPSPLPPEAKVYTLAMDSNEKSPYYFHAESHSMCESDETGSTRSTVVSRLSMLSFNNINANESTTTATTKRIEPAGHYYGHNNNNNSNVNAEGIEGMTTPFRGIASADDDDEYEEDEDGIPLAPPLHFQDGINKCENHRVTMRDNHSSTERSNSNNNNNHNNNDACFNNNPSGDQQQQLQLIEITDDDELALLAEQLGLGQDEEEDEAEELRKFLLLEEKLKTIHDKDKIGALTQVDKQEDDDDEDNSAKGIQQQHWDIITDRIAEEDEQEHEEEKKVENDTNPEIVPSGAEQQDEDKRYEMSNELSSMTADNNDCLANVHKEFIIEKDSGIAAHFAAAAKPMTESSASQGIVVTMTTTKSAKTSQPEKDEQYQLNQQQHTTDGGPTLEVDEQTVSTHHDHHDEDITTGKEKESAEHEPIIAILRVKNPLEHQHEQPDEDKLQWTVKVSPKHEQKTEVTEILVESTTDTESKTVCQHSNNADASNSVSNLQNDDDNGSEISSNRPSNSKEEEEDGTDEADRRSVDESVVVAVEDEEDTEENNNQKHSPVAEVHEEVEGSTLLNETQSLSRPEVQEEDEGEDTVEENATVEEAVSSQGARVSSQETINQGSSSEAKGMEGSHEVYHPFSPPTFSRLPPDGDEFPNSWSDENGTTATKTNGLKGANMYDSKKQHNYGTEVKSMIMKQQQPPPPVPSSEPPAEEETPPPLPSTVPPKALLARRSSSVEERKRLFAAQNNANSNISNNNSNSKTSSPHIVQRAAEPSKKSVKDKIAMFSSRSSSTEDETKAPFIKHPSPSLTASLPRSSAAGSAFSKSSDNLLASNPYIPPKPSSNNNNNSPEKWTKMTQSTYDLSGRKNSIDSKGSRLSGDAILAEAYSKLNERSQSMLDVGQENQQQQAQSYQRISSATYTSRLSSSVTNGSVKDTLLCASSTSLIENRRKAQLTKLRGLVIPDKAVVAAPASSSVVDLPTIVSKDAVILPTRVTTKQESPKHKQVTRTESLDSYSCAKPVMNAAEPESATATATDWKAPSALPKYSPAFKRRGLMPYQSPLTPSTPSSYKASPAAFNTLPTNYKLPTPEPKSLESLTSPHSDSSFEFTAANNTNNNAPGVMDEQKKSMPPPIAPRKLSTPAASQKDALNVSKQSEKSAAQKGKMEDSDNDSAVSSSRSSISHGLSPPNSPTPEESSSTPDPDMNPENNQDGETEDSNSDEGWRILKPQSVEAINRKNVLASAKFSSGGGRGGDDKMKNNRRSDDEAGYADGEAEDTESSCSELDVSSHRRRSSLTSRPVPTRRGSVKVDNLEETLQPQATTPSHSAQSSVDLGDVSSNLSDLNQSPLQAIFDMEVQMAYINEICDALPARGSGGDSSRYFSRRDSEATVIERPITVSRKNSHTQDQIDGDRRSRNRSSSGNESDFSSSISVGSQSTMTTTAISSVTTAAVTATTTTEDKWSVLEKKYSKSLTSVNLVGGAKSPAVEPVTPKTPTATSTPIHHHSNNTNNNSNNNDGIEKSFSRMMEKSATIDGKVKAKIIGAGIPRGRNDFKSLSEKWQQLSSEPTTKPTTPVKPPVFEKPATLVRKTETTEYVRTTVVSSTTSPSVVVEEEKILAGDGREWSSGKSSSSSNEDRLADDVTSAGEMIVPMAMSTAKRSVSVNDIRKAFEKAEIAVNTRDDNDCTKNGSSKDTSNGLSLPSAHFRVSSFDSTTSEESSATTPAGLYGSVNSLVSSAPRDPYGSITSLASSTSLISPQELQQLIDEANQSLEEAGTPSHEVCVIILHREYAGGSLGITLAGGADYETKEITVHKVLTGSIADRDGRVHRGDRVLSINGKSTRGLTHREALNLLKAPRTEVVLVVSRGRSGANGFQTIEESSTATLDRAVEPLLNGSLSSLLENEEESSFRWGPIRTVMLIKDGAGLGFSLEGGKGSIHGDKPLTVKKIFVGGPAEKCGELKVGDLIVSINGVNMSSKSRTEAWNFMKKLGDGEVKINVRTPLS